MLVKLRHLGSPVLHCLEQGLDLLLRLHAVDELCHQTDPLHIIINKKIRKYIKAFLPFLMTATLLANSSNCLYAGKVDHIADGANNHFCDVNILIE